jgi:hypothetical protein
VGGRGVSEVVQQRGVDKQTRPAQCRAAQFEYNSNSNELKLPQNLPNFDRSKNSILWPEKFEIKYGFETLEKMNNFLHRNFFRF